MFSSLSLKSKLILSYIIVIVVSFGAIAFFLDKQLAATSLRAIESSLVAQARLIENQIAPEDLRKPGTGDLETLAATLAPKAQCRVTVIDPRGMVLADSDRTPAEIRQMDNHLDRPEIRKALAGDTGVDTRRSPTLNRDMMYVALPLEDKGEIAGILRLAVPLESVEKALRAIRRIIALGLLFAIAIAVALGSLIASRTTRPINRMIHVSRKFSEGDFSRRIIKAPSDEIGELAGTLNKMAQDIEGKIREISAQNQKLAAVFNSMIEGIIVTDAIGVIVSVNRTIERIFGVQGPECRGRAVLEVIRNNQIADIIRDTLESGRARSAEIELVYPVRGIFQINATAIFDGERIGGCLAVIHDITEIRRLETIRSDFVANVSHELKTPLTSIKGFVETLLDGALADAENGRAFLKIIQEHTGRLDSLVSDLLALSHLESKEMTLERTDYSLRPQVDEVILAFSAQSKKRKISIANDVPQEMSICADRDRIGQVFTNLVDNAVKFNKEGGTVRITARGDNSAVRISVEDTGIGIPAKDLQRVFERFYRVDKARSRELGGTGLGLSIVKHVIELHGGSVGVESTEGLCSKFWFTLPK